MAEHDGRPSSTETPSASPRPTVLAYYFPNWHQDHRNADWFGPGWTEWNLLQDATPRYDGHRQPRVPARGYEDESDPAVSAEQIELARRHGVDGFLVDYYWYDDGSYLSGALDNGLLQAPNRDDITFAIMWANHELLDIFPTDRSSGEPPARLMDGAIDRAAFERMTDHVVSEYFSRDNYLTIDGCPWFSVYEIGNLIKGLGGVAEAAEALESFRAKTMAAGHPGLHLDAVVWGFGVLPTAIDIDDPASLVATLGFASATSYVWIHHADAAQFDFPAADAAALQAAAFADYEELVEAFDVPFYPNVTVGWDASPRTAQGAELRRGRYPFSPVWDQDPSQFRQGLLRARRFLEDHPVAHPIVTINAWNEWTEGSALLPDETHGLAYLEAVQEVFGQRRQEKVSSSSPRHAGR